MQTRMFNEATIGFLAIGKIAEIGRQLTLATDKKFAEEMGKKTGAKPEELQKWANGFVALDAVISVMGVLAMIQGMRKNRKGAGQAGLVQGVATIAYSIYYLFYSLVALSGGKGSSRVINLVASLAHTGAGVLIYRFAQRAVK